MRYQRSIENKDKLARRTKLDCDASNTVMVSCSRLTVTPMSAPPTSVFSCATRSAWALRWFDMTSIQLSRPPIIVCAVVTLSSPVSSAESASVLPCVAVAPPAFSAVARSLRTVNRSVGAAGAVEVEDFRAGQRRGDGLPVADLDRRHGGGTGEGHGSAVHSIGHAPWLRRRTANGPAYCGCWRGSPDCRAGSGFRSRSPCAARR